MTWGSTQLLTEMISMNLHGVKGRPDGAWGWVPYRHL
jgi:hypothetical protein